MEKKSDSEISAPFQKHPSAMPLYGKSEKKYRDFLKNIHDGCFELDLAGKFVFFNDSVCRIAGYSSNELMGMSYREYTDEETAKKVFIEYNKVFTTGEPSIGFDWSITRKDGAARYIETSVSLQKDSDGKPIGFIGIVNDVTERRRSDELLRQSEEKYRLLAEHVKDFLWILDLNLRLTYVSPSVEKISGYNFNEIKDLSLDKILTEKSFREAYALFISEMSNAAENPPPKDYRKSLDIEFCCKDSRRLWIQATLSFLQDENGTPVSILGEGRDITERRQAEQDLKKSEEKYRTIIENIEDGYAEIDLKGNFLFFNDAISEIHGYSRDELMKMNYREYMDEENSQKIFAKYNHVFVTGKSDKEVEYEIITKSGRRKYLEVTITPIKNITGHVVAFRVVVRDRTQRRLAEEKLQKTLESLKKAVGITIQVLLSALEARDPYTAGHQSRVADLARAIATEMGLNKDRIEGLRMAGIVHDIGKLSIPSEILSKPSKLTDVEFLLIKGHSQSGYEMLKNVESPWPLAEIVYQHHERINGSGYPRNLKGDEILLEARILAVADVVEAMASHRPYRPAKGIEPALEEIEKNRGISYDEVVVDACLRLFREKRYQFK